MARAIPGWKVKLSNKKSDKTANGKNNPFHQHLLSPMKPVLQLKTIRIIVVMVMLGYKFELRNANLCLVPNGYGNSLPLWRLSLIHVRHQDGRLPQ
jgi:hypothetical protein